MLIALPNLDGSFTVTLFLPKKGPVSFERLSTPAIVDDFFGEYFADARGLIPTLSQDFFANPTGELGTVRCWPWTVEDCAMLIGDAAHAVVPFHGQGMNAGFEDCAEFARLLDETGGDWPAAMATFERIRKPNADAIAAMALENYLVMRDRVLDPKFALKKEIGFELERMFPRRFIPRYSMVMFHRLPYAVAYERGSIQEKILDELVDGVDDAASWDRGRASELVRAQLPEMSDID
jgi:kynurenine 3-monooxygenase